MEPGSALRAHQQPAEHRAKRAAGRHSRRVAQHRRGIGSLALEQQHALVDLVQTAHRAAIREEIRVAARKYPDPDRRRLGPAQRRELAEPPRDCGHHQRREVVFQPRQHHLCLALAQAGADRRQPRPLRCDDAVHAQHAPYR